MAELTSEPVEERNRRWDEPFGDEPLDAETVARILALPNFANVSTTEFQAWLPLDKIIANDGRLRRYQRGEVIIRKGDYGNSLFIILEGGVLGLPNSIKSEKQSQAQKPRISWWRSIAQLLAKAKPPEYRPTRRRGRDTLGSQSRVPSGLGKIEISDVLRLPTTLALQAPQVFGELAALTGRQRTATFAATDNDTLLFELRWQGVRDIRTWSTPFRQRIDQLYRERGLVSRLRECPVFHHLDQRALDEIAKESLFETYGSFDWMHRFTVYPIKNLLPATRTGRCDDSFRRRRPYRRQQNQFSNLHGNLEMLLFVSERSSHTAATGWNNLDFVIHRQFKHLDSRR